MSSVVSFDGTSVEIPSPSSIDFLFSEIEAAMMAAASYSLDQDA